MFECEIKKPDVFKAPFFIFHIDRVGPICPDDYKIYMFIYFSI